MLVIREAPGLDVLVYTDTQNQKTQAIVATCGRVLVTATYAVFLVVPAPAVFSSKEVLEFGTMRAQGMRAH